jgi:uncharacterized membrane protein
MALMMILMMSLLPLKTMLLASQKLCKKMAQNQWCLSVSMVLMMSLLSLKMMLLESQKLCRKKRFG